MTDINICIIGAGVIGLAIAAELSKTYDNIFVLEKNKKFGQESSSRNSEVIHSGIYYPTNSLKARLCVEGRKLLYEYCEKNEILFNKCGKLIVANNEDEILKLKEILKQSQDNGVDDGTFIDKVKISELEPNIKACSALYFPSTGIIDSHGLMKQLETDAINNGVQMVYNSEVIGINKQTLNNNTIYKIEVSEDNSSYNFTANYVINAGGLYAENISNISGIKEDKYKIYYWKGEYFGIGNGKSKLINRLIYPVPNKNNTGLGVHVTIDLSGGAKLGPNTIFLENNKIDYTVDKNHKYEFYQSATKFLPFINIEDLHPDQAGIRPKLQKPGDLVRDFIITEETKNGFPKFINLIGMESPGLTASLAIAKKINELIN